MPELQLVSLATANARAGVASVDHGVQLKPVALLHLAILFLVVANVGRIPVLDLGQRQAPILVGDIAVGLAVAVGLLSAVAARSLKLDVVALVALLFAAIGAGSAVAAVPRFGLSGFELIASLAYLARWLLYFGLYVLMVNFARPKDVGGIWTTLETAMLLIAAFGVVQAIFLPNFAFIVYPDQINQWDAQRHRLVSTVLEPNVVAAMFLTVFLVQIAQLMTGARIALWKPLLMLVALVMTLSRSGAVGLIAGGFVILLATRRLSKRALWFSWVAMSGFVISLPALIPFAAEYNKLGIGDDSATSRIEIWIRAIQTLLEHPWVGVGFNTYGFVQERRGFERTAGASYSAEGGLLFIAVMTGIVGLSVFVLMLWQSFKRSRAGWKDPRATSNERALCIGSAAATLAVCVHSVFVNSLLVPFVMLPLWVLWGLVYVSRARMRQLPSAA